jgi:aryl-alcohol dehydrogenase (NADP+)
VIVYNPLAGGMLSGKHRPDQPPPAGTRFTLGASGELYRDRYWHTAQFEAVETLRNFCQNRNLELATLSVAWVLSHPEISAAIVGASRPEQLAATLAAADLTLDDEMRAACDSLWWTLPRRPVTR